MEMVSVCCKVVALVIVVEESVLNGGSADVCECV